LIIRFTGKSIDVASMWFLTGFKERKYATIAFASSSLIARYSLYGITGNSARPSGVTPSRIARMISPSVQRPIPVSGSGVMLRACRTPGMSSNRRPPAPSVPGFTGIPHRSMKWSE
jgi:hypothetical protein